MAKKSAKKRKPGRPSTGVEQFNITIPPDLGEWAKRQPEGLSGLVRRLLSQKREKEKTVKS